MGPRWELGRSGRLARTIAGAAFFSPALWVSYNTLRGYPYHELREALRALPATRMAAALAFTTLSYCVLTGHDLLALRYVGRALPVRALALASFVGNTLGNNAGSALVTGATVRYWIYATRIVIFCNLGFWLGYLLLGALFFLAEPLAVPAALHLPVATTLQGEVRAGVDAALSRLAGRPGPSRHPGRRHRLVAGGLRGVVLKR